MRNLPCYVQGDVMKDGTVFVGVDPKTDRFIYAVPCEGAMKRLFNRFASKEKFASRLNTQKAAGHDDWHKPSASEKSLLKDTTENVSFEKRASVVYIDYTEERVRADRAARKAMRFPDIRAVRSAERPYELSREKIDKDAAAHDAFIKKIYADLERISRRPKP